MNVTGGWGGYLSGLAQSFLCESRSIVKPRDTDGEITHNHQEMVG